ncbi:MAG: hypothetical protein R3D63_00305 [Paracoccaceae bacterium]
MANAEAAMKQNQYALPLVGVVLILGAAGAVFLTASEYDSPTVVYMGLGFDLLMTIAVAGLLPIVARGAPASGLKTAAMGLGVLGLIAGIVKLIARFSSDHGWWTGHFNYAI